MCQVRNFLMVLRDDVEGNRAVLRSPPSLPNPRTHTHMVAFALARSPSFRLPPFLPTSFLSLALRTRRHTQTPTSTGTVILRTTSLSPPPPPVLSKIANLRARARALSCALSLFLSFFLRARVLSLWTHSLSPAFISLSRTVSPVLD